MSPQFHVKFDDFFETVQAKVTDLDAPDPEWKYLSGFGTKKGAPKSVAKGGLNSLLAPRRGANTAMIPLLESTENAQPAGPQEDHPLQLATDVDEDNQPATQHPVVPAAAIPLTQQETPAAAARQTRSGRVINNTP